MIRLAGLKKTINAVVRKGESHYVAECLEISVVTQGKTLDETIVNLQEAVRLHLEGEDLAEMGLAPNPTLLVTGIPGRVRLIPLILCPLQATISP